MAFLVLGGQYYVAKGYKHTTLDVSIAGCAFDTSNFTTTTTTTPIPRLVHFLFVYLLIFFYYSDIVYFLR